MGAPVVEVDTPWVGMFFRVRRLLSAAGIGAAPNASLSGGALARGRAQRPR